MSNEKRMATKPPTQEEIAAELGVSGAALSKLKARGMPTHSADATRAWRSENLHPGRRRKDPGPSPRTLVERGQALSGLASGALKAGRFDLVADELRAAMRAVPSSHRCFVQFEPALLDALIGGEALRVLRGDSTTAAMPSPPDAGADTTSEAAPMSDEGAEYVGSVCYQLACGEAVVRGGGPRRG